MTGQTISHYRILEKLGEGGMGVVYKAEDTKLRRTVALKFLPPHALENRDRFLREAQAAAALNHPNICTVFEIDEEHGFLAMELIDGVSVKDKIAARPLPLEEALDIAMQTCAGLQAAHEKGIVHRDIKSANLMLTAQGQVKIMDFGLAQVGDRTRITKTGSSLGTPAYMSPEQAKGDAVDRRTDIWSLGVVLYEMLAGRLPFRGDTEQAVSYGIVHSEPEPLSALRTGVPLHLDRIAAKALAKSPDQRYQHVEDLLVDLRAAGNLRSVAAGASPVPNRRRTAARRIVACSALIAASLAGVAVGVYSRPSQAARTVRFNLAPPVKLGDFYVPRPSPDGSAIVYPGIDSEGRHMLWLRPLDSEQARPLAGTEGALDPFWSPDSRWIAFYAQRKLKKVNRDGANVQTIAALSDFSGGAWSSTGEILLTTGNRTPLYRVPDTGGTPRQLTTLDESRTENSHRSITVLPDGRHFLFLARCGKREYNALYEGSLESGEIRRVAPLESNVAYMPSREGRPAALLFAKDGKLFEQPFDGTRLQGEPVALMDVHYNATGIHGDFALSADGSVLVTRPPFDTGRRLTWFDRNGKVSGTLGPAGVYSQPQISPDGRRVIFNRPDDSGGNRDIWMLDTDRAIASRLTVNPANEWGNTWSPDGRRVIFASDRSGNRFGSMFEKSSMDPGAGEVPVEGLPNFANPVDWSTDGRWILFADGGAHSMIWIAPTFGEKKPFRFLETPFQERLPTFSPDGKWIAYHSDESGRFEIYVRPFSGAPAGPEGKVQVSERGGYYATWSRDGKEMFFVGPDSKMYAAPVTALGREGRVPSPRALFDVCPGNTPTGEATQGRQFDVAPDGRFLFVCGNESQYHYSVAVNWKSR